MKIVKITYGTHGKSKEYSYLTNGKVRNGQIVQPTFLHNKTHKITATTGVIQHTYSVTSKLGSNAQVGKDGNTLGLRTLYTGNELGIPARDTGLGKAVRNEVNWAVPSNIHFYKSDYVKAVRQGNLDMQGDNYGKD